MKYLVDRRCRDVVRFPEQGDSLLDKLRARFDAYQYRVQIDDWPNQFFMWRMECMIRKLEGNRPPRTPYLRHLRHRRDVAEFFDRRGCPLG